MTPSASAPDVSWRPDAYIGDLTIAMKRTNGVVKSRVQRDDTVLLDERQFDQYGKAVNALYSLLYLTPPSDTAETPASRLENKQMSLL